MSDVRGDLCRLCAAHSDLNEQSIDPTSNLSQIIWKYLSITVFKLYYGSIEFHARKVLIDKYEYNNMNEND
mgnify:CR=1 FL=1